MKVVARNIRSLSPLIPWLIVLIACCGTLTIHLPCDRVSAMIARGRFVLLVNLQAQAALEEYNALFAEAAAAAVRGMRD